jgi:putative hemolysin
MQFLSWVAAPLVWFLSKSTEFVSGLLGVQGAGQHFITDFDVFALMREGIHSGEFDAEEHAMVRGALELDDIPVRRLTTPRTDVIWFDVGDSREVIRSKLGERPYAAYPVCEGDIDTVIGIVRSKDLLVHMLEGHFELRAIMREPLFVPETVRADEVLRQFKQTAVHTGIVVDEHGGIEGIIALNDIVEAVLGDVDLADPAVTERPDGSWLMDGHLPIETALKTLTILTLPDDESGDYQTLSGFVMTRLGHILQPAETFDWEGYRFEIMDMDGKRVDKVLVQALKLDENSDDPAESKQADTG